MTIALADIPTTERPDVGIVHLGIGAFYRAHCLSYIEDAMAAKGGDWGVIGVSLRRPDIRDKLAPQDGVYVALQRAESGDTYRVMTGLRQILFAGDEQTEILNQLASPAVSLVTLTVTEKGYCHLPASGELDVAHPDIIHDLSNPAKPKSVPGYLVAALARRHKAGLDPFTALSCDNLSGNGALLRRIVLSLARANDPALADWIAHHGAFPASMVDRIVPATTAQDRADVLAISGLADVAPVIHEPFRQWVIEDNFVNEHRPVFEDAGVQMVADVEPYERMKLRCLNGTHSALAYLGSLAGLATVSDAVANRAVRDFIDALWQEEIIPSLPPLPGIAFGDYCGQLMARYQNAAIVHRTQQIAMDGSQKLPQRILETIEDNLRQDRPIARLTTVVAAWMLYLRGENDTGTPHDVVDPLSDRLVPIANLQLAAPTTVDRLLAITEIFPTELAANSLFRDTLVESYQQLSSRGTLRYLEQY